MKRDFAGNIILPNMSPLTHNQRFRIEDVCRFTDFIN